ncbi:putative ATP-binding cassette transporter [Pseudomonas flavescens]|uniref:Putative ATP-binding cassette transporter n=1 Tax=Phytopseudomonas flavescens TaxID=29435 RepID=A0A1G8GNI6_9GAMM|nr:ABC transporter ATP-binding protein/permease [Pseudomonas flavescens]SDH95877.1 putative ATP-binding cassette transporter [Pseudomonas flavescens]
MHSLPPGTRRPSAWQLIIPYWVSRDSWKGWLLLATQLALMFSAVYVAVWSNQLDGEVVDAMVKREWEGLWQVLLTSLAVSLLAIGVSLLSAYLISEMLRYQWRSWMTRWFIEAWTQRQAFYAIERDGLVDNPDQRIAEDIETFIQLTLTLSLGTVRVVVTTITFSVVLWHLSGTLEFSVAGQDFAITGYMVYLAFAYALGSLLVSHYAGRQLIGLFNRRQSVEANFRYRGMQLRENAEQIAFYNAGPRECQRLLDSFSDVKGNWRDIIVRTCKMMLARDIYVQTGSILPTLGALPRYLSGAISLGDVTRITGAFNSVYQSLSFFTQAYVGFAEWLAVGNRLRDLSSAIHRSEQPTRSLEVLEAPQDGLDTTSLRLERPDGEVISAIPALRIGAGERWLIRGPSGAGKSTLLRAIAGIWPYGQGTVRLPRHAKLMFLPQRSYIPHDRLKAALCYPAAADSFDDATCRVALRVVQLPELADQLDANVHWQQHLSGGEQQRLAVARALLHKPDYLFLDEATSALDAATEQTLYEALLAQLPGITLISVAHRETLEAFHDHTLEVVAAPLLPDAPSGGLLHSIQRDTI